MSTGVVEVESWTVVYCSNGVDEEGDALTDCADPDCYAAEHCPSRSSSATLIHDAGTGLR